MARIPIDASYGVQRSFEDLNEELRDLKRQLSQLSSVSIKKSIEDIQADVKVLQHLRRIPPQGQRAFVGSGLLYLDDQLNWSGVGQDVGVRGPITSSTTVLGGDYVLLVDASAGNVTLSLPAASLRSQMLYVKKVDNTVNKVILDAAGADVIDGDATLELLYLDEAVPIVSDGISEWDVL